MSAKNKLSLAVQYPDARLKTALSRQRIRRWVQAALFAPAELTVRFVDAQEGRALNRDYRGKDQPTNVLTFAYDEDAIGDDGDDSGDDGAPTRADIVLCTDVLLAEAAAQNKSIEQHAAHLLVHGVLHAQGYDHEDDAEALEMEQCERDILAALGYADPYGGEQGDA